MMKKYQDVFKRYEKKYMLDRRQYTMLRRAMEGRMQEDQYGLHTICNLYFDTDNYSLIRTSLNKPLYKEKLRLRSYGVPGTSDFVFLELKKKFDGVVYKRRIQLKLAEAYRYLLSGMRPEEGSQILREIDWFLAQNKLSPKAFIAYDRIAMFGVDDPELRMTFDANLRAREHALDLTCGDQGYRLGKPEDILLEVKLKDAMPVWLSQMLSAYEVYPTSFSKYGVCYTDHILNREIHTEGGVVCA